MIKWNDTLKYDANAEQISANEAKLIMTSMDAILTLTNVPQMKRVYPHQNDVKLHTCGKWLGSKLKPRTAAKASFLKAKIAITAVKLNNMFFKNIGYTQTHHAHAVETDSH